MQKILSDLERFNNKLETLAKTPLKVVKPYELFISQRMSVKFYTSFVSYLTKNNWNPIAYLHNYQRVRFYLDKYVDAINRGFEIDTELQKKLEELKNFLTEEKWCQGYPVTFKGKHVPIYDEKKGLKHYRFCLFYAMIHLQSPNDLIARFNGASLYYGHISSIEFNDNVATNYGTIAHAMSQMEEEGCFRVVGP